jgi:predicted nucleic acid-binding protein
MGENALVETDILYALMDVNDAHHKTAIKIFDLIKKKKLTIRVNPLSLLELELLIRSGDILIDGKKASEHETKLWFDDFCIALKQHGIILESIECEDFVISAQLRSEHNLSFFDSHYAAYVKRTKSKIITMDKAYDRISEIERTDPRSIPRSLTEDK